MKIQNIMNKENVPKKLTIDNVKLARKRLIEMHYESGVGHIGGNLSSLMAIMIVFHEFLKSEDRFILSKGHSAGALYVSLWSVGCLKDQDLKLFHKDHTLLAGHPPANKIPEISFATGSLGHGLSLAAGTALALKLKGERSRVICLTSDGEWQEGSTWEALIFAIHNQLINLTILVDHNELQGFGSTSDVASMSPLWEKLKGFDIDLVVIDGHDLAELRSALEAAQHKLKIIIMQTIKGHGISFMERKMEWHYLPLTDAQFKAAIREIEVAVK
jgi:transketolase